MSCRPGGAWAGCDGRVHVWLEFGTSEYVSSVSAFRARLPEHHVDVAVLPYTRTHLWPILARRILPEPVPYHRAPGPVNWARFRPPAESSARRACLALVVHGLNKLAQASCHYVGAKCVPLRHVAQGTQLRIAVSLGCQGLPRRSCPVSTATSARACQSSAD